MKRHYRVVLLIGFLLIAARDGLPASTADPGQEAAQPGDPQTTDQKLQQLQEQVDQLARKLQATDEKNKSTAKVSADLTGFTIQSSDRNFLLKIGADLQADSRMNVAEGSGSAVDSIVLRRIRPTFSGTVFQYVDYFFRPDFGMGSTIIYDAYVELKYFSRFKLRAGKFKPGVGLERLQSDDDTSFVERGFPTLLVPSRDIGYQLSGDIVDRRMNYSVGVFNGVPDNSLSDSAVSNHRDYTARLFFTPFQPDESALSGLGFGFGSSFGSVDGEGLPSFKTFRPEQLFSFCFRCNRSRPSHAPGAGRLLLSGAVRPVHRVRPDRGRPAKERRAARRRVSGLAGSRQLSSDGRS